MCTAKATAGTMQMPGQDPDSAFTPTEPAVPPHKQDSCGAVREKSRWASGHSVAPESTAKPLSSQAYDFALHHGTTHERGNGVQHDALNEHGMHRGHSLKNTKIVFPSTTFSIISSQILLRIHPSFPIFIWGKKS